MRRSIHQSIQQSNRVGAAAGPSRRTLLAGAAALALTGPRFALAADTVIFGVDFYILAAPVWIAQDKGFFREFGINAEIQPFSLGIDSVDAVLTGRVNFGVAIDFATNTRLQSGQLKIVTALLEPEPGFHKLAVAAGIGKPQDLMGKRIGIANGTAQHLVTMEYLRHAGIGLSQITLLPLLSPLELVASLRANRIDAAFLWGDATNQAKTIPGVTILSDDKPALVRSYGYSIERSS
jgi:ABC-type nitrate/sulfonate/bicarbonate transport system substrate-binding protein